jgi:hypothetical protein
MLMSWRPAHVSKALIGCLGAAAIAAALPAAAAAAGRLRLEEKFTNWVVSGSLTPRKLGEPVTLPKGSTFNGVANLSVELGTERLTGGTVTGLVYVPPFDATMKLVGLVPTTVHVTFTQVGQAMGTIAPAPPAECAETKAPPFLGCVTLSVPTKANLGITEVGLLGIQTPTHCQTVEPVSFALTTKETLLELIHEGSSFEGEVTIPSMVCEGLSGALVGPALTTLISGPDNPYALEISPPPAEG